MVGEYDVVVIGTGVAGSAIASKCSENGMSVAIIDSRGYGGTCPQRGCVPKKVLVSGAKMIDWPLRMAGKGSPVNGEFNLKWNELIEFKRTFTEPVPENIEKWLSSLGIDTYKGHARFLDAYTLDVDSARFLEPYSQDVDRTKVKGKYIVVATGAKPVKLGIEGEEHMITSEQFLELDKLPDEIVFVGGGFISFEFAHVAARAGAKVTILQRTNRVLKGFDPGMVDILVKATKDAGIDVITEKEPVSIEKSDRSYLVTSKDGDTFKCGLVVNGAGRIPATDNLGTDLAGISTEKGRIIVNEYMQSISCDHIYAAGDVTGDFKQLTPTATHQAPIVATNIIQGNVEVVDYTGIPSAVFTIPTLASVGIDETHVDKNKHKVVFNDKSTWHSTRYTNHTYSASKIIIDESTGLIAGAHLLGPGAEEVINLFAMAIRLKIPAEKLKTFPYLYPTVSTDIRSML